MITRELLSQQNTLPSSKPSEKTTINETYVNILQNIYSQATARIRLDRLVSEEFTINRGVRQGDLLSTKLYTAVIEDVFKKADISEGINVDGESLTNLWFALLKEKNKTNGKKLKQSELRQSESWPKNTQGKDKIHDKSCRQ